MIIRDGLVQIHHRVVFGGRYLNCNHYLEASAAATFPSTFINSWEQETMSVEEFSIWHDLALEQAVHHSFGFGSSDEVAYLTNLEMKIEDIHINEGNPYRGDMGYVTENIWTIDAEALPRFLVKIKADSPKQLAMRLASPEFEDLIRSAKIMSKELDTHTRRTH